jgi:hypothetical protein
VPINLVLLFSTSAHCFHRTVRALPSPAQPTTSENKYPNTAAIADPPAASVEDSHGASPSAHCNNLKHADTEDHDSTLLEAPGAIATSTSIVQDILLTGSSYPR